MKKFIIGITLIFLAFLFITLFVPSHHKYTKNDCAEDNICKEGLTLNIDEKEIVVTKDSCIEYNGKWKEDIAVCFFR